MQPVVAVREPWVPAAVAPARGRREAALVVAVTATGQERLRAALRRIAAAPDLLAVTARVVVVDAARTPSATVLREAVRLPPGLLRIIRTPEAGRPEVLARSLAAALEEADAASVLLLDDVALTDPEVLGTAFALAGSTPGSEVVGLRDPGAGGGPESWWGALLPFDVLRAVGAALPEAGPMALADLVLRARAVGFLPTVLPAPGPVPAHGVAEDPAGAVLLALLHAPLAARTRVLAASLAAALLTLLSLRPGEAARRHAALLGVLRGSGAAHDGAAVELEPAALPADALRLHLRLWFAWPALRKRYRVGALDRSSATAWADRFARNELHRDGDAESPRADDRTASRPGAGLRSRTWSTTRRGTSAA